MEQVDLTAEQEAERQAIISQEGQIREFRDAMKQALNTANLEIVANGGQPGVDAVISALTSLQAEFIAMAPARYARRMQIKEVERELPRLVALRTGAAI